MTTCFYCGKEINRADPGVHRQMMAWASSPDRPGAGMYADLEAREPQNEWCCSIHVRRLKDGLSPVQESLLA